MAYVRQAPIPGPTSTLGKLSSVPSSRCRASKSPERNASFRRLNLSTSEGGPGETTLRKLAAHLLEFVSPGGDVFDDALVRLGCVADAGVVRFLGDRKERSA